MGQFHAAAVGDAMSVISEVADRAKAGTDRSEPPPMSSPHVDRMGDDSPASDTANTPNETHASTG